MAIPAGAKPAGGCPVGGGGGPDEPVGGDLAGTVSNAEVVGLGGVWKIVRTWAEFAAISVEAPAGVWTYDVPITIVGDVVVPTGDRIVSGEVGFLRSFHYDQGSITGNVDAKLISGPLIIRELQVTNASTGASAWAMEMTSLLGRNCFIARCGVTAIRGIRVSNLLAAAAVDESGSLDSSAALIGMGLSNVIGVFGSLRFATLAAASGSVGFDIDSSTVVAVATLTTGMVITLTDPPEHGVAISESMVLAPGAVLHFSACSVTGPQDRFLRQDPGDMLATDIRFVANGNPSLANWGAVADVGRLDVTNFLEVVLPASPSDPVVIPYDSTVPGPAEIEPTAITRFTLFKDPSDTSRWWARYSGPLPQRAAGPGWSLSFAKAGGADRDFTAFVEVNKSLSITSVQQDDGGVFTDFTSAARDSVVDDVPLTPDPFAVDDANYYGSDDPYETLEVLISQSGVGTYTIVYEFWNGVAWVSVVGLNDGTAGFTAAPGYHDIDHTPQGGWAQVAVNGITKFYIRSRLSVATTLTTQPRATQVASYAGFTVVDSTVAALFSTAARQTVGKRGELLINPGDRFHPALQNGSTGQTINIQDVSQSIVVT